MVGLGIDFDRETAEAFERAASLDPLGRDARRAQVSLYLSAGRATEATEAGGDLLRRFPDDKPVTEAVLHLLNHRLDTIDGEYVVLGEGAGRALRPPRPAPGLLDRLRTQRRVIRGVPGGSVEDDVEGDGERSSRADPVDEL